MSQTHPPRLLAEVTCPNCWHRFAPERTLFIAQHASLMGDEIAGPDAYVRFLPTRFNLAGDAIDARGMACQQLACPRCHLEIARPMIEMLPFFTSIVGVPASGKSYYLAALTWELRQQARRFGFTVADGDPTANAVLQGYEQTLFMNPRVDEPVMLAKTQEHGAELYQTIAIDGQAQAFPRPFLFTVSPSGASEPAARQSFPHRTIVLYDNAGEHFLPGHDTTNSPVTLHLAESATIMFLFDPTQDPRFRRHCRPDPQLEHGTRPDMDVPSIRQEIVLNELAARVRRYRGLSQAARHERPLVVILAKADIWLDEGELTDEPHVDGRPMRLDLGRIERLSARCRDLLDSTCPEIVSGAEGFAEHVVFIPVSSLGRSPEVVRDDGKLSYGIQPRHVRPRWVTVPMLWSLSHCVDRLVPVHREEGASEGSTT